MDCRCDTRIEVTGTGARGRGESIAVTCLSSMHGNLRGPTIAGHHRMSDDDSAQQERCNVLFLCTGNSARSIMAECLMERIGGTRFRGFSAGSFPAGTINPHALEILERRNHRIDHLRSKDWAEFATPGAPALDFVFTLCDRAAGEVCPVWPGQPISAHWGFSDPAAVEGKEAVIRAAFADAYREIATCIEIFASLPLESLDGLALKRKLEEIGASRPSAG